MTAIAMSVKVAVVAAVAARCDKFSVCHQADREKL